MVSESLFDKPPPYKYLLDTSAAISQKDKREKHPRDINVTLWQNIDQLIGAKVIVSCSEVSEEINQKDDAINSWFRNVGCVCLPIDDNVQLRVTAILEKYPGIVDFRKNKSSSSGDVFVIATAMKWHLTIITLEDDTCPHKIPMVCKALEQDCVDIYGLCKREGWKF